MQTIEDAIREIVAKVVAEEVAVQVPRALATARDGAKPLLIQKKLRPTSG